MLQTEAQFAIVHGYHGDPFAVLGMHVEGRTVVVRALSPQASLVEVLDTTGVVVATLPRIDPAGLFGGPVAGRTQPFAYRLRLTISSTVTEIEDAYRFGTMFGELDEYLIGEGRHLRLYDRLGAHPVTMDGVAGTNFAVWAPSARRVSVVGDFNDWDGRRLPMRLRSAVGIWEIFVPGVDTGAIYKFEVLSGDGRLLPLKADPFAFAAERSPGTASIVAASGKSAWSDAGWMAGRARTSDAAAPMSVYEVHLGSWRRADGNRYLTYAELAEQLVPYASEMGFTHIELLPVTEHPFDGSWGYQPIGMFAPTSRFGSPEDFARFVESAHAADIGIIMDWVPGHFPTDAHGLGTFDGSHLYEHADPRQGFQPDWNTLIFNFDRNEVVNYLIANALFWIDRYHVDALRVDAVASMLYLDYSRKADEWIPNVYGGRENLGAIRFLQAMNEAVASEHPGAVTIAEESTSWPGVSRRVSDGGLGFDYKWNMGWMHDTLAYARVDPLYRSYDQDQLTFSFMYAFSEKFLLPYSHDEVVHGKGSLINKMSGDRWQQFATLRALYGYMFAHPGKKLLFMGCEFAQEREWNHDRSLDWHLLGDKRHAGIADLVRDLNAVYRRVPALHVRDHDPLGMEFIVSDTAASAVAFARLGESERDVVIALVNFSATVHHGYRVGVPQRGRYDEIVNTDAERYGGSGVRTGSVTAEAIPYHGRAYSIVVTLPPLGAAYFALGDQEAS